MVLDRSGSFSGPLDVHVEDGRIVRIDRDLPAHGAASIDFSGLWLLPGIFDCHDHVAVLDGRHGRGPADARHAVGARGGAERAPHARGGRHVRPRPLRAPTAGSATRSRPGYVPGPRLQISVVLICQTGGHGDGLPRRRRPRVDADPRLSRAGRRTSSTARSRCGTSCARTCAPAPTGSSSRRTGGLVSEHDQPLIAELTPEEIAVAVFEAGAQGKARRRPCVRRRGADERGRGRRAVDRARRLPHRGAGRG